MNDTSESNYEMLKAIYDYEDSSSKTTLNFKTDDEFYIYRDVADKKSWCLVINAHGELGYVPYTYVKTIYVKDTQVLKFLESCIVVIREEIDKGDQSSERVKIFETLMKRQKKFKQKMLHNTLDTPVSHKSDDKSVQTEPEDAIQNVSSSLQSTKITIPDIYEIVQQVRNHTGLSYNLSQVAVSVVTQYLSELVCERAKSNLDSVRDVLDAFPPTIDKLPVECLENTKDGQSMQQLLEYLSEAKEDSQQRSWQIYDDHVQIEDCLVKLGGILKNADPLVINHVLKVDQFRSVSNLLDYYQMELRWAIRKRLLEVFTQLCKLNYVVVDIVINSVLPMELAREMQNDVDDDDKKMLLAEFLTLVLSVGETLPIICFEYMNLDFVTKILRDIENVESKINIDEKNVNCMINLLLSYNLQFSHTEANVVLNSLSTRDNAKVLTENLLLLLNTEKDPVNILDLKKKTKNSVVKMLNDMLADPKVAKLFYVNDIEVLVDIVIRCLLNIPAEEESRTSYLELCKNVIFNTDYLERGHKLSDLNDCLKEIVSDDNSCTKEQDLRVINEIYSKYPESFN
ncbi:NCK-interacting protein with SH3 domain [Adelges cooleyi]|uniref:NCK-interacting protein with SH3 domain n=1 Tax=Adelges cooleyi TaxID=133065 RepID=UPI00217F799A|nr:NCK-interacting protein with SH3 domain [Adelges cooleyi]XP_050421576.1 NCK-interacting protein with SH3 domain [Adelges cooleyi]XP_050421577.1 NCK-interacting protein with SH3 domain [Adelges cooleyi]